MPFGGSREIEGVCISCASELKREQDQQLRGDLLQLKQAASAAPFGSRTALHSVPPYNSAARRAQVVIVLLVIGIILDVIAMLSSGSQLTFLNAVARGAHLTRNDAIANDARQVGIAIIQMLVYFATAVAFCLWLYRVSSNLNSLRAVNQRYSPVRAVGGFFIPIVCLVWPYEAVKEIWIGSDPQRPETDLSNVKGVKSTSLIGWWWISWLIANVMGYVSLSALRYAKTIDQMLSATWEQIWADAISIISAILVILVIREINARQGLRAESLRRMMQQPSSPVGV